LPRNLLHDVSSRGGAKKRTQAIFFSEKKKKKKTNKKKRQQPNKKKKKRGHSGFFPKGGKKDLLDGRRRKERGERPSEGDPPLFSQQVLLREGRRIGKREGFAGSGRRAQGHILGLGAIGEARSSLLLNEGRVRRRGGKRSDRERGSSRKIAGRTKKTDPKA